MKYLQSMNGHILSMYLTRFLLLLCSFISLPASALTMNYVRITDFDDRSAVFFYNPKKTAVNTGWLQKRHYLKVEKINPSTLSQDEDIYWLNGGVIASKRLDDEARFEVEGAEIIGLIESTLALSSLAPFERQVSVPDGTKVFRFVLEIPFQRDGKLSLLLEEVSNILSQLYARNTIVGHTINKVINDRDRKYGLQIELATPANHVSINKQQLLLGEQLLFLCRYPFVLIESDKEISRPASLATPRYQPRHVFGSPHSSREEQVSPGLFYYSATGEASAPYYMAMEGVLDPDKYSLFPSATMLEVGHKSGRAIYLPKDIDSTGHLISFLDLLFKYDLIMFKTEREPDESSGTVSHQLVLEQGLSETDEEFFKRIVITQELAKKYGSTCMTFAHADYVGRDITFSNANQNDLIRLTFIFSVPICSEYDIRKLRRALELYANGLHEWHSASVQVIKNAQLQNN